MAHFIASIEGNRGPVSRLGSKAGGIRARAQGWDLGVRVMGRVNAAGEDEFTVVLTGGSHGHFLEKVIGTFQTADLEK